MIGSITGASMQYLFKMTTTGNLRFALGSSIATIVCLGVMFVSCPERQFAGMSTPYPTEKNSTKPRLYSECNSECHGPCDEEDLYQHCFTHPRWETGRIVQLFFDLLRRMQMGRTRTDSICACTDLILSYLGKLGQRRAPWSRLPMRSQERQRPVRFV